MAAGVMILKFLEDFVNDLFIFFFIFTKNLNLIFLIKG